ncbi:Protein CHROMATIN REMODELING 20, partial [Pseudocercospora fuligena]
VANFFRYDAADCLSDMPNARLPDTDHLAAILEENDVAGSVLLSGVVDTAFLKEECGVKSLGMRSAVIHCITKLKSLAATFANQAEAAATAPDTPKSIAAQPQQDNAQEQQQEPVREALPSFNGSVGEHVRAGELEVQDGDGRKRRKLNLVEPAKPRSGPAAYFSDYSLPIDSLFYGSTAIGEEIKEVGSGVDSAIYVNKVDLEKDRSLSETNFSFQEPNKLPGECQYIYRQMRYMMQSAEEREVVRRGRKAIAITPYREHLQPENKARSATVVRMIEDDAIAVKENAAFLASGVDYGELELAGGSTAAGGEFDYLLDKYRTTATEKVFAMDESESETAQSSREDEESDNDSSMAEVEDEDGEGSLRARMDAIMDVFCEETAAEWKEKKIPRLEEKEAWKVWKMTKKSRSIQEQLLHTAKSSIEKLQARLIRYKAEVKQDSWQSENQVKAQCAILQPTIEEIEYLLWKMDVWKRKKEPFHVARHGHHQASGSKPARTAPVGQRLHIPLNDRLSVEPADIPMVNDEDENIPDAETSVDHGQNESAAAQNEEHDASDEMSDDNEDFVVEDQDMDTGLPSSNTITPNKSQHGVEANDLDPPVSSPTTKDRRFKKSGLAQKSDHGRDTGTDSDLPSPSAFFPSQASKSEVKTPTKKAASSTMNRSDPIEISSDSPPAKPKRGRPRGAPNKKADFSGHPESANAKEVASWNMQDLVRNGDRKRILIKLLFEIGGPAREKLANVIRTRRVPQFSKILLQELSRMQSGSSQRTEGDDDAVPLAARLYLAQVYPTHLREIMDSTSDLNVDLPWNSIVNDHEQSRMFAGMLDTFLKSPTLFAPPKVDRKSSPSKIPSDDRVISLLDSSDDGDGPDTPQKRKKRHALTKKSAQSQAAAFERQKRFNIIESQASNSQDLQAMIQSDPSMSTVAINIATKDDEQDLIFVDKGIAAKMKDHQITGVRFMWRELTAQGEDAGQGCVLAHTMGLGKTMQTIAVLIAINEAAQSRNPQVYEQIPEHLRPSDVRERQLRTLVLCPPSLVENWRREINKWAGHIFQNVYAVGTGSNNKEMNLRLDQMRSWHKLGGVLLVGYTMFLNMVNWQAKGENSKVAHFGGEFEKHLLKSPELVVADEAHHLKNDKALVSRAAKKIHTESRIGLTGTPMSNDVDEIYSLISFVAPDYLGERGWFTQQFSTPIKEGNSRDSTSYQRRRSLKKLAVLHSQIEPKVNRADITVLRGSIKSKVEYAITMPLTAVQHAAYTKFLAVLLRTEDKEKVSQVQIFSWLAVLTLLLNHPRAFKRKLLTPTIDHLISDIDDVLEPSLSSKMSMLMDILQLSKSCDDKVLVFSSSIPTLDYVAELLNSRGYRCGRIDGNVAANKRQQVVENFNNGLDDRNATLNSREWLFEPKEVAQAMNLHEWIGKDEKVLDTILKRQIKQMESGGHLEHVIRSLITTETLQEDAKDEPLNEEEQREESTGLRVVLPVTAPTHGLPMPSSMPNPGRNNSTLPPSSGNATASGRPSSTQNNPNRPHGLPAA